MGAADYARRALLVSGLVLIFGLTPGGERLHAQEGVINEVIVTARKREESLQETPLAVTAITADQLELRSFQNLTDVSRVTPNMVFDLGAGNTGGSGNAQIFIRGIGQTDFLFTSDPGVGLYVDGVYFARSTGIVMDLDDLERVEILRGPQGTLFGKNTIGGAINIISRHPQDELDARLTLTTGSRDRLDVQGMVNLPLVPDKLKARVTGSFRNQDGYVDRLLQPGRALGDVDSAFLRGLVEWTPAADWTFLLAADWTRKREESVANELIAVDTTPASPVLLLWNSLVAPGLGTFYDTSFLSGEFTSNATGPSYSNIDMWGVALTAERRIGENLWIKSITAYRNQDLAFAQDQDHSPLRYTETTNDNEHEQISQELQLGGRAFDDRLDWVLGGFYMHEEGSDVFDLVLAGGLFSALEALPLPLIPLAPGVLCPAPFPTPCAGGAGNPFNVGLDLEATIFDDIEINSYAAFGQGTFDVTDQLSVTGGLRYTYENKDFGTSMMRNASGVLAVPPTRVRDSWDNVSGRAGLEYQWTPDVMTYFSAARGFKSGGFNGRAQTLFEIGSFDPEKVMAYEIGVKSAWFDNRLQLNVAGFFSKHKDMQLTSLRPIGGLIVVVTENAGEAEMKGAELEFVALPVPDLQVRGGFGYIDAEYTKLDPGTTVSLTDELVNTPNWTASFAFDYSIPMDQYGLLIVSSDVTYRSSYFNEVTNFPLLEQDGYALVGARLTYKSPDERWSLAVFGTNLTDERYITNGLHSFGSLGTADATFGRPREWGVSLSARL